MEKGFNRVLEQVELLHPGFDLGKLSSFKIAKDGKLVDEE